jgi:uncharacterized protein
VDSLDRLREAISGKGRLLVLFSGGLDSAVLARAAHDCLGEDAAALTFDSTIIPVGDLGEAVRLAALIGIRHVVVETDELSVPGFASNPPQRCYLCRKARDAAGIAWARHNGFEVVADGSNASDLSDYRPGMRAAREDGIWQPFAELGIAKDEIRAMARQMGLPAWDRPATVCLCSRFPYGSPLEEGLLRRVEAAEEVLRRLGFRQVRVRHFPHDTAVVEVDDPAAVLGYKGEITRELRSLGYACVTLDLEGYASGKLNRTLD